MPIEAKVTALLAQGDHRGAVELIMDEHGPRVRGLLHTLLRRRGDAAEDAFSLFAERLWTWMPTYRGEGSLRSWIYTIARNAAVTVARDGWAGRRLRLETEDAERLAESVRTRSALRLERRSSALDALRDQLDMDDQILLTLRLDEQLPWEEVAQAMSDGGPAVEAAALRKRFERLKTRLGDEARRQGLVE